MIIATFGPTTGWSGKTIDYDNGLFTLEGHGPISSVDVLAYDQQGHLTWAHDGLREWTAGLAASEAARAISGGQTGTPVPNGATTPAKKRRRWFVRWWAWPIWALTAFITLIVIVAIVAPPEENTSSPSSASITAVTATLTAKPTQTAQPKSTPTPAAKTPTPTPTPTVAAAAPASDAAAREPSPAKGELASAFSGAHDHFVQASWDGGTATATAVYDASKDDFWDENGFVDTVATDTVDVLTAGFKVGVVQRVSVIWKQAMSDAYGNANLERGVQIDWTRSNWNNIKDVGAFKDRLTGQEENMYELSSYYYIHPGIWKETKLPGLGIPVEGVNE